MPTRPTTRTSRRCPIPAAPWCRQRSRSASSSASAARMFLRAVALGYDIGPRVTMCLGTPGAVARAPPQQPQHRRRVRRRRCGRLRSQRSTHGRCAGCSTTPRSRPPASPPGRATASTSRRRSCSAACRRAAGVTSALLVRAGWTGIDDIFSGADNFLIANSPNAEPGKLIERSASAMRSSAPTSRNGRSARRSRRRSTRSKS